MRTALLYEEILFVFTYLLKALTECHEMNKKTKSWPTSDTIAPKHELRFANNTSDTKNTKNCVRKESDKHFSSNDIL